jgi:hypothetical protein
MASVRTVIWVVVLAGVSLLSGCGKGKQSENDELGPMDRRPLREKWEKDRQKKGAPGSANPSGPRAPQP